MGIYINDYVRQYLDAQHRYEAAYEEDMRGQNGVFWRMTSSHTDHLKEELCEAEDAMLEAAKTLSIPDWALDQLIIDMEGLW